MQLNIRLQIFNCLCGQCDEEKAENVKVNRYLRKKPQRRESSLEYM